LPKLTKMLDGVPNGGRIRLNIAGLALLDHTCAEVLTDWIQRKRRAGTQLELAGMTEVHGHSSYRRLVEAASA
jgi:ABC-type transporter Mla MlaB component